MGILAALNNAKGAVLAIAAVGGGAIALDARHTPQQDFDEHVSSSRVQTILQMVEQSREEGSPKYLCRAIDKEIAALCTQQPGHYFCRGQEGIEAQKEMKSKAGCL